MHLYSLEHFQGISLIFKALTILNIIGQGFGEWPTIWGGLAFLQAEVQSSGEAPLTGTRSD